MHQVKAYILLMQGENLLPFLDGLSSNLVDGPCTTVFTDRAARVIDACEVIVLGDNVALVGYGDVKERLSRHLLEHRLGQNIEIRDISDLNKVFIGNSIDKVPSNATVHQGWFGTVCIVGVDVEFVPTWSKEHWLEHRVTHAIPFAGHEITSKNHPFACGLGPLVHENKGCYIGQEVLVRMRSRGKFGHRMVVKENPAPGATTVGKTHSLCIVRDQ